MCVYIFIGLEVIRAPISPKSKIVCLQTRPRLFNGYSPKDPAHN